MPHRISNHAVPTGGISAPRIHHENAMSKMPSTTSFAVHAAAPPPAANANGAMSSQMPTSKLIQILSFIEHLMRVQRPNLQNAYEGLRLRTPTSSTRCVRLQSESRLHFVD